MIFFYILWTYQLYPILTKQILHSDKTLLIFHYIERDNVKCALCSAIETRLKELDIPVYKLNPYQQVFLGLRLFSTTFPAFTIKENQLFYRLDVFSFDELKSIIAKRKWHIYKQIHPNSFFSRIFCYFFLPFLYFYSKLIVMTQAMPSWFFSICFGMIGVFLFFNLFEIFAKD